MPKIKFDLKAHEQRMLAKIQGKTNPDDRLKDLAPPVAEKIKEIAKRVRGQFPR